MWKPTNLVCSTVLYTAPILYSYMLLHDCELLRNQFRIFFFFVFFFVLQALNHRFETGNVD